jgi:hypothetical protein
MFKFIFHVLNADKEQDNTVGLTIIYYNILSGQFNFELSSSFIVCLYLIQKVSAKLQKHMSIGLLMDCVIHAQRLIDKKTGVNCFYLLLGLQGFWFSFEFAIIPYCLIIYNDSKITPLHVDVKPNRKQILI